MAGDNDARAWKVDNLLVTRSGHTANGAPFKPVTCDAPCRICGKPKWCRRSDDGGHECKRETAGYINGYRCVAITEEARIYRSVDESKRHERGPSFLGRSKPTLSTDQQHTTPNVATKSKTPRKYENAQAAAEAFAQRKKAAVVTSYEWSPEWIRWRLESEDGKSFLETTKVDGAWICKGPAKPHPLFQTDQLPSDGTVYVVEGEKCVLAARSVGLSAITSGSCKSAAHADWSPLAGRDVVVLPDNDEPGRHYATAVLNELHQLTPAAIVRVVELPDLAEAEDLHEFVSEYRDGQDAETIRAEIEALVAAASIQEREESHVPDRLSYKPFPIDALPKVVGQFVTATAGALGCEPAFVALPVLATLGASIGTTRAIQPKPSWREFPIIWVAVVARSGTLKSPAFDAAMRPLRDAQYEQFVAYAEQCKQHDIEQAHYKIMRKEWEKNPEGDPPAAPIEPVPTRYLASDTTIEALAVLISENPRGLCVAIDELARWIGSFKRYRSGHGSDEAQWLEFWRAGPLLVDRKTGDRRLIVARRAAVSVVGTIQPGTLERVITQEHIESGLSARLLLAQPMEQRKRWSSRSPDRTVIAAYASLIRQLLTLEGDESDGQLEPLSLKMTPDAETAWRSWYDENAKEIHGSADDEIASALAKLEAYALRFALIAAIVADPNTLTVDLSAMRAGIALANWFTHEARRLYSRHAASEQERDELKLLGWIERQGMVVSPRDLVRNNRRYRNSTADAELALNGLVDAGYGQWQYQTRKSGGAPSKRFVLNKRNNEQPVDKTFDNAPDHQVLSTVDKTPDSNSESNVLSTTHGISSDRQPESSANGESNVTHEN